MALDRPQGQHRGRQARAHSGSGAQQPQAHRADVQHFACKDRQQRGRATDQYREQIQ
jgi:hypothetical protein